MARPRRDDDKIHLHARRNGNSRYASSNEAYEKDGTRKYRVIDWGTLDENDRFFPAKRFLYEHGKWELFVFPKGWDLSKFEELKARYKPGRPAYTGEDRSLLYGSVWLLTKIAEKVGIVADLKIVFDGNIDLVHDVLTLAFFPVLSGKSYNHLSQWQGLERMPSATPITSRDVTLLTQSITEAQRMKLFNLRMRRVDKRHVLAIDSTTKSTYGTKLADIRWGKNKEGLALAQTSEVVIYCLETHEPVVYQELAGNAPDQRTVVLIRTILVHAGCPDATWLTDRGYATFAVLDFLISKGIAFICCIKSSSSLVTELIAGIQDGTVGMRINTESQFYEVQREITYWWEDKDGKGKLAASLKANIYYDPVRRAREEMELDTEGRQQELLLEDLTEQKTVVGKAADLERDCPHWEIAFDEDGRVASYRRDEKRIAAKRRTMGYIVLLSHRQELDATGVWDTYALRDEQEKYFADMKGAMGDDRNPAWSEKGKEGRMFIHFVGLVVYSHIKRVWKELALKDRFPTVEHLIDEMKNIRCIEHNGRAKIITPFVGKQLDICGYFGLEVPDGCAPAVKAINSKTGRKKKSAAQA